MLTPGRSIFRPWRLLPGYTRLMRDGAIAPAVVLRNDYVGNPSLRRISVRVLFDDGEKLEITRTEGCACASQMSVGEKIQVRYDPKERSRVQLDMEAFDRRVRSRQSRAEAKAVRRAERSIEEHRRDE